MHIAAYIAACDIDDLDRSAKAAVIAVAGRANRHSGAAWVSVRRIARDMGDVAYNTARLALERAVTAGYLAVDKSPSGRSRWQLTSSTTRDPLVNHARPPRQPRATKDSLDITKKERNAVPLNSGRPSSPGEKVNGRVVSLAAFGAATKPEAIAACRYCDEFGWLWRDTVIVGRCSHARAVSDLTLATILGIDERSQP